MKILVASATEMEILPFLNTRPPVAVSITGVGIANSLFQLTTLLSIQRYDLVIQAGIAGCFSQEDIEKVVVIGKDVFGDIGALENGKLKTLAELNLQNANLFPYEDSWLINKGVPRFASKYPMFTGVTVSTLSDDREYAKLLKEKYEAQAESMEGACLHFVALQKKIPFVQLRALSNVVGDRDKKNWKMKNCIEKLNSELVDVIKKLTS